MKVGSLFSGIGGLDLGLERAGMEILWQVEINDFCQKVLKKHWPNIPLYSDVHNVKGKDLKKVDLLCGGFPCQDISTAKPKGKGLEGEQSGLWWEFYRLIREIKPHYVLIENVSNLKNRGLEEIKNCLRELDYESQSVFFRVSDFGGPHRRRRCFIIANDYGERIQRLEPSRKTRQMGSWGWRGKKDLRDIARSPFGEGTRWPKPLLRRMDDGVPNRVDRLKSIGNAVVPQIAEYLGSRILEINE